MLMRRITPAFARVIPSPRILPTVFTVVQRRYRLGGLLDERVEACTKRVLSSPKCPNSSFF